MGLSKRSLYGCMEQLPIVGPCVRRMREPLEYAAFYTFRHKLRRHYRERTAVVLACPDNEHIPRVRDAGKLSDGFLIMHNGIKVHALGYYGTGMRVLMQQNRGCHEPQEERVFREVLKWIPAGATMVELGAAWGFYSMWFHSEISDPKCFLVEPDKMNFAYGKANFRANGMTADFELAAIGKVPSQDETGATTITVDGHVSTKKIDHIHILHADIQEYELDMLHGAKQTFDEEKVDFVFVSTHTPELHAACRDFLSRYDFQLLADVDLPASYSWDGLLVGVRPGVAAPSPVNVSLRHCA